MSASTGHFPGAPFNADPVTTMATSSSQPVTSSSGASQIPPQATQHNQGASTSAVPTEQPTQSARGAEQPPGTAKQAVTEPTVATTSATASTSTTTTTTTTTTTATGRFTPQIPPDFCLFLIRKLRSKQNMITHTFLDNAVDKENLKITLQHYKEYGHMTQEAMIYWEKLDAICRRLPRVVPPTDNVNMMRTLYTQEHTMCHMDINGLLERMIDSGNWNEGNFQIFHYLSELLRANFNRRPNNFPEVRQLPPPVFHMQATNSHATFEKAYSMMKQEIVHRSLGIYPKTLNHTSSSLVVEFLFGCGGTRVVTDSDIIYTMKFLLVERNGSIEYINMVAPHEKWFVSNNYGIDSVDPFVPSSYEVYRRLTRQANIHLLSCFGSTANRWSSTALLQFISLFGKFREVFTTRCRVCRYHFRFIPLEIIFFCRRHLKNFLPPLIFDIRNPSFAAHEACR
uniref:Tyrosine-protein phosphatase domain-containing protein n=1 Tax=Caenorhabditis tropicalis TaxID=1561998 RepID=A0A1I7TNG7_9PELO